jgi:simple sugar transport system permease protein
VTGLLARLDRARPAAGSVLAIAAALVGGAVLVALSGLDPVRAYVLLAGRAVTAFGVTETLVRMAPVLMVATGILVGFKGGLFNVGIDGQFLIGAFLVGVLGPGWLPALPPGVGLLALAAVGFAGGALWAVVPALLKVRYGLHEIITTIMMNYVAVLLTGWLVKGPFRDPTVVPPQTPVIPEPYRLPAFLDRVHLGLLAGIAVLVAVHLLLRHTKVGFKVTVLGRSRRAALHAGFPVGGLTLAVLLLSAGFAGLAGANDVLSVKGLFQGEWNPGYGLTAVSLVLLARLNAFAVVPLAYFFSFLLLGGELMSRDAGIPVFFIEVLNGLMLIFFAAGEYLERRPLPWTRSSP